MRDAIAEVFERFDDLPTELSFFPGEQSGDIFHHESARLNLLNDGQHMRPQVVAVIVVANPPVTAASSGETLATWPSDYEINVAAYPLGNVGGGYRSDARAFEIDTRVVLGECLARVLVLVYPENHLVADLAQTFGQAASPAVHIGNCEGVRHTIER
nr:hypothetical protein [Mycobacteroides abscessus]